MTHISCLHYFSSMEKYSSVIGFDKRVYSNNAQIQIGKSFDSLQQILLGKKFPEFLFSIISKKCCSIDFPIFASEVFFAKPWQQLK